MNHLLHLQMHLLVSAVKAAYTHIMDTHHLSLQLASPSLSYSTPLRAKHLPGGILPRPVCFHGSKGQTSPLPDLRSRVTLPLTTQTKCQTMLWLDRTEKRLEGWGNKVAIKTAQVSSGIWNGIHQPFPVPKHVPVKSNERSYTVMDRTEKTRVLNVISQPPTLSTAFFR